MTIRIFCTFWTYRTDLAASWRGVEPMPFGFLSSNTSNKILTTSPWPFLAARWRGVKPLIFGFLSCTSVQNLNEIEFFLSMICHQKNLYFCLNVLHEIPIFKVSRKKKWYFLLLDSMKLFYKRPKEQRDSHIFWIKGASINEN